MSAATCWQLIANPAAGGGRGARRAVQAQRWLERHGHEARLARTEAAAAVVRQVTDAAAAARGPVLLCGGDGTVHAALPALVRTGVSWGLVPAGTANDLARSLALAMRLEQLLPQLLTAKARPLDAVHTQNGSFVTVASCGFDACVNHWVSTRPGWPAGTLGYVAAALWLLPRYASPWARLRWPGGERTGRVLLVAAANTFSYGGGLRIAPEADPADGLLEVCWIDAVPSSTVLRMLPAVFNGGHVRHPAVTLVRAPWFELEMEPPGRVYADGDPLGLTPMRYTVQPGALNVLQPAPRGCPLLPHASLAGARSEAHIPGRTHPG